MNDFISYLYNYFILIVPEVNQILNNSNVKKAKYNPKL